MTEVNFNSSIPSIPRLDRLGGTGAAGATGAGEKFQQVLKDSMAEVNRLQADADQAINALSTGKTNNVAEVMTAVQKADLAFKTLLQIRNKLLDAYSEVRQMRM